MDYASSFQNSYRDLNYKRPYNTDTFYTNIIQHVSNKLKRQLEKGEQRQVINFIKKLDPSLLTPINNAKTISIMIDTLVDEFSSFKCGKSFNDDSYQILRETIGISSESGTTHSIYDNPNIIKSFDERQSADDILDSGNNLPPNETKVSASRESFSSNINNLLGMTTADEAARILNPKSQYKKNHILLDSRYRIFLEQSVENISKFQWNYIQKSQITINGSVNVIGNVRDIIGLRIYPFRIPYAPSADNKYAKISVFIEELSAQSFIAHENRKFHFMMNATIDSDFITLDADVYNGFFWFEKPITSLSTLTVSFGNPLELITFNNDRDWVTIDYFIASPSSQITTEKNHNLQNGDRVYFTGFDVLPLNPILINQTVINENIKHSINSVNGHLITKINSTTFSIPFDSSQIQSPIVNQRFRCFYGSKRLFVPIELIYINPNK